MLFVRLDSRSHAARLQAAELRLLLLHAELKLLRDLAKRDDALNAKLDKARTEKATITAAVLECKQKLAEKKAEIEVWQEKDEQILNDFHALVSETHPAAAALLKIFRRKMKRSRKRGDDDESSDEESEFDDDDSDLDDDDEGEEDACPPNCDQTLYDKVLELREKRLDQEEVLNDFQKVLEDLKKTHDRHEQRERQINKDLAGTNAEIQQFQTEKQRQLNRFEVNLTLTLSQIMIGEAEVGPEELLGREEIEEVEVEGEDGVRVEQVVVNRPVERDPVLLPTTIPNFLVFARDSCNQLKSRITELAGSNRKLKRGFKDLGRQQTRLKKEKRLKETKVNKQGQTQNRKSNKASDTLTVIVCPRSRLPARRARTCRCSSLVK